MSQDDDTKFNISSRLNSSFILTALDSADASPETWLVAVCKMWEAEELEVWEGVAV